MLSVFDYKAISRLLENGRSTWAELGELLGMTPQGAAERVRRLEDRGVIKGYTAIVDPRSVGWMLTAFVSVTLEHRKYRQAFLDMVQGLPEVQECHHMTGDFDFLLKVRCRDTLDLDRILGSEIKGVNGILRTSTSVVLNSYKEQQTIPPSEVG